MKKKELDILLNSIHKNIQTEMIKAKRKANEYADNLDDYKETRRYNDGYENASDDFMKIISTIFEKIQSKQQEIPPDWKDLI